MKRLIIYLLLSLSVYAQIYSQFDGGTFDGFNSVKFIISDSDTTIKINKSSFYGDGYIISKYVLNNADTTIKINNSSFYGDGSFYSKSKLHDADTLINYINSSYYGDGCTKVIFSIFNSDTTIIGKSTSYTGDGHFKIIFDTLFNYGLQTPINLRATLIEKQKIFLEWDEVDNALNYKLFRADNPDGPYYIIYNGINLFYSDSGNHLSPATHYYYRIMGNNNTDISGYSDILEVKTLPDKHLIQLNAGWNMISTYIKLNNMNMEIVLLSIVNDIVIVKNNFGQIYFPEFEINDIGNWNYKEAYQVYTKKSTTLEIEGAKSIPQSDIIELNAGWNMLAYLRDNPINIETALASLTNNSILIIAKDNMGNVFYPAFDINMIGDMVPGQGYQIYLVFNANFLYPEN